MLFVRHPKPVVDNRAVAVQVVQQQATPRSAAHGLVAAVRPDPAENPAPAARGYSSDTKGHDARPVAWGFRDTAARTASLSNWNDSC